MERAQASALNLIVHLRTAGFDSEHAACLQQAGLKFQVIDYQWLLGRATLAGGMPLYIDVLSRQ